MGAAARAGGRGRLRALRPRRDAKKKTRVAMQTANSGVVPVPDRMASLLDDDLSPTQFVSLFVSLFRTVIVHAVITLYSTVDAVISALASESSSIVQTNMECGRFIDIILTSKDLTGTVIQHLRAPDAVHLSRTCTAAASSVATPHAAASCGTALSSEQLELRLLVGR